MFQAWRLQLREAEEAADQGQLDEAWRLLTESDLRRYLPGKRLGIRVAAQLSRRALRRVIQGNTSAGWQDLRTAQDLAGETEAVLSARQEIISLTLSEAEGHIESGNPARATELLEHVEHHQVRDESIRRLKEVARRLESAHHLARSGRFAEASAQAQTADKLHPECEISAIKMAHYQAQVEPFRQLTEALHRNLGDEQWSDVVRIADQMLELAPENRLARDVRRRAWAKVGAQLADSQRRVVELPRAAAVVHVGTNHPAGNEVILANPSIDDRFLLWIDGVGGFLVCLNDEVVLGQAASQNSIAIPIQADISRQHARLCRRGDGYVIDPLHATWINGQMIRSKTLVSDGDEIELSGSVKLRFRQPHALSASARLEFLSRHRTVPKADGVLLMAESCVLGPKWQNHVVCRDWQGDVVLYRRDGELYCRAMESIEIDGQLCDGRGKLTTSSHVSGSDFSLSLEELS